MTGQELDVIEGDVVETQSLNLFGVQEPEQVVEKAASVADALATVVRKQGLVTRIQGRDHVRVEGWTLLGSMLGVFPVCVWSRKLEDGWEARVEARTRDGAVVGAAEAECLYSEKTWKSRDDYALRSMAQTRATSKALRQPLGFVMTLAGFDATPAEEMPREQDDFRAPDGATARPPSNDMTPNQDRLIKRLLAKLNYTPDKTFAEFGSIAQLSKAEASQVIERLKAEESKADEDIPF